MQFLLYNTLQVENNSHFCIYLHIPDIGWLYFNERMAIVMKTAFFLPLLTFFLITGSLFSSLSARTMEERTIYYISGGVIGSTDFWSLFLGNHECTIYKEYPGEGIVSVDASLNISMVPSGYIQANGYSDRGKIELAGQLICVNKGDSSVVPLDSLDFVSHGGRQVRAINGVPGDLVVEASGAFLVLKKMKLQLYKLVDEFGDKVLKSAGTVPVTAVSYSKAGIQRAKEYMASK